MQRKRTRRGRTYGDRAFKISEQPNGRFRVQSFDPIEQRWVSSAKVLGLKKTTFVTRSEATDVGRDADEKLGSRREGGALTVRELAERWAREKRKDIGSTDGWTKESTAMVNEQRIRRFVELFSDEAIDSITEDDWHNYKRRFAGTLSHLEALKAMFAWAASSDAGRLIQRNPFGDLKSSKTKGNKRKNPPSEAEIERMITFAYTLNESFGAWLDFACFSGLRPGEIDALRWEDVEQVVEDGQRFTRLHVRRHWSRTAGGFTLPKSGVARDVQLSPRADRAIKRAWQYSHRREFVFVNTLGDHWTADSRSPYWLKVYKHMGWPRGQYTLYLSTRHFAGWYMTNRLDLESEVVAQQLGHADHGTLVRQLYGHRDQQRALRQVRLAYAQAEQTQRQARKDQMRGDA